MKTSQYTWNLKINNPEMDHLKSTLEEQKISTDLAPLLWHRGIRETDEIQAFFSPTLANLNDPFLLFDMEKAVNRIQVAVEQGEKILIYGDYDADGITSTTVMKEAIELIGGDVSYYLPNRFEDGYGPNLSVYKRFIEEEGVQLIITVDNGVSGHEAVQFAQESGVDVVITDHHELPESLPNAHAIVHPRHPNGTYPFSDLAGVGVAFKVATALLGEIPVESLDLVAIGTIADLVSLTHENRVLVKLGLDVMRQSERVGLHALASVAKIDLNDATEETIGFTIGPRLNAIGRLGDASPGVELLSTFDDVEADNLATFIQQKNEERQGIVKNITAEALVKVSDIPDAPINIIVSEDWHEGVLGIVASRLVQETNKPTLVLSLDKETGIAKGSGRSIQAVDLFKALTSVKNHLLTFGGHHMAAGLSFNISELDEIKKELDTYLLGNGFESGQKEALNIDGVLAIETITVPFIESLRELAPFGTDNPAPMFEIVPEKISQLKQIGADNNHLKCQLVEGSQTLDCIAFGKGNEMSELEMSEHVAMVGQLSINEWNGFRKPQLMLKDYEINDLQVFDARGKKGNDAMPQTNNVGYLIFDEKNKNLLKEQPMYLYEAKELLADGFSAINERDEVVMVDCPYDLEIAKQVFGSITCQRIFILGLIKKEHYLTGLPTREQFGKLFKLIATQGSIDIRYKLPDIVSFLKIEKSQLIFMINVFFELGFVTIDDGLMKKVANPPSRPLEDSQEYQSFIHKSEMEKLFLYSDIGEIKRWISQ